MSEQTPDTNNSMSDGQDPSMEDILASIRKIIADDDVQEADTLEADQPLAGMDTQATEGDVAELAHVETLDLDIIADEAPALDADIDALIGDMDAGSEDDLAVPPLKAPDTSEDVLDDILDLEIPMDEPEKAPIIEALDETLDLVADEPAAMEDEIAELVAGIDDDAVGHSAEAKPSGGLMGGAVAALGLGGAAAAAQNKGSENDALDPPQDDLSLMLDNMVEDIEDNELHQEDTPQAQTEAVFEESVIDPDEDLLAEIDLSVEEAETPEPLETEANESDPDMDLVKSLMADLTEEPLHDEDEVEAETTAVDIDDAEDASSDDVMDEILSMTLDDETKLSEEIAIPEMPAPATPESLGEGLSLKEIAAQAEADALDSEDGLPEAALAGLGAAAISGAGAVALSDDEPEADDVDDALSQLDELLADDMSLIEDLEPETPTPESLNEETPEMARAKKTDAIIDEVTETATAGAFASLTNVVEDKAVRAERGDRIGDLVMEALQPMLKEWLDANLKGIVERAVTKEVKRISSGK